MAQKVPSCGVAGYGESPAERAAELGEGGNARVREALLLHPRRLRKKSHNLLLRGAVEKLSMGGRIWMPHFPPECCPMIRREEKTYDFDIAELCKRFLIDNNLQCFFSCYFCQISYMHHLTSYMHYFLL